MKQKETQPMQTEDYNINISSQACSASQSYISGAGPGITSAAGPYITKVSTNGYTYTIPAAVTSIPGGYYSIGSGINLSQAVRTNIASFSDINGKEIVRINLDGSVTWAEGYGADDASINLARAFTTSAEIQAGITQAVKLKMRDSVFKDIIEIARQKGSLTADDLTYLLEASKIVEKLTGATG